MPTLAYERLLHVRTHEPRIDTEPGHLWDVHHNVMLVHYIVPAVPSTHVPMRKPSIVGQTFVRSFIQSFAFCFAQKVACSCEDLVKL